MNPKAAVKAIEKLGGCTEAAARLNPYRQSGAPILTPFAVHNWTKRGVPLAYCVAVERELKGAMVCEELRQDFDWTYLRNTKPKKNKAA
jgi:hypothetical protein